MAYPYRVVLDDQQRAELRGLVGAGIAPARMLTRARILLKADHGEGGPGWSDAAIPSARSSASTRPAANCSGRSGSRCLRRPAAPPGAIPSMSAAEWPISSS